MLLYWGVFPRAKFRMYLKCPPSLLNFPRRQIALLTSQNWLTYTHTQICTWGFQFLSLARQTLQLPLIKGGSLKSQPQTSTKTLSEDCTFLNAEAGKNTQNTTHIDVQSELWKAQLSFHHLHQKNQRKPLVTHPGGSNSSSSVPNCSIPTSESQALLSITGFTF